MNNEKEVALADFEKAFEEMYKAGVDNNQAIVFLPNRIVFNVFKVDANVIKTAMYFNTPKDLSKSNTNK